MKRVLLTGMSGTGKSSVVDRLVTLGYRAVDLDGPLWSTYDDAGDWIWQAGRVRALLDDETGDLLFVSGCATTRSSFIPTSTSSFC